jgi:hypothetical protein
MQRHSPMQSTAWVCSGRGYNLERQVRRYAVWSARNTYSPAKRIPVSSARKGHLTVISS